MSITEPTIASDPIKADTLRLELKAWEKAFASTHEGRKASREDIKQHPTIAQKYKLYTKLRSASSQPTTSSPGSLPPLKRPASAPEAQTPQKRAKHTTFQHPAALDPYDPPRSARKSPIQHRISIGPTPQKDGRVLGLFDLLSPASSAGRTPSKRSGGLRYGAGPNLPYTPSKKKGQKDLGLGGGIFPVRDGDGKSPADASKRSQIASRFTPTARRTIATPSKSTPLSHKPLELQSPDETPAFLRRHSQHGDIFPSNASHNEGLDHDGDDDHPITWTPIKPRRGPRMAGKGLSALVRGLREMEEEKLDEDLDILRELEDGANGQPPAPGPANKLKVSKSKLFDVPDSQIPDMPLGADGANWKNGDDGGYDDLLEPEKPGKGGRKIWKKKGQKRTTRRVIMRPVSGAWKPEPKWKGGAAESEEEDNNKEEKEGDGEGVVIAIAETQITQSGGPVQNHHSLDGIETDEDRAVGSDDVDDDDFELEMTGVDVGVGGTEGKEKGTVRGRKRGKSTMLRGDAEEEEGNWEGEGAKEEREGKMKGEEATRKGTQDRNDKAKQQDTKNDNKNNKQKKKINPMAHANFRALKIRNKNSKGKGGGGKRFGRRR